MTGERTLAGSTFAVADGVAPTLADALRDAGADLADGSDPDIVVGAVPAGSTAVTITPTGAREASVSATHLELANAASAVLVGTRAQPWPSDTTLAAPPRPVVAVPDPSDCDDADRAAITAAIAALVGVGAHLVAIDAAADAALTAGANVAIPANGFGEQFCSVTVPVGAGRVTVRARPFHDAVALDVAAAVAGVSAPPRAWPLAAAEHTELVVFGAHLRGGALEHQLTDLGARWAGEISTSDRYRMTRLPTSPPKPAVTRVPDGCPGSAMRGQRWLLSPAALGRFLVALPAPMQLGKVEFADGSWRTSFGCDGVAADAGADISRFGGWEAAVAAGAVS